ncbi:MAG TPA: cell division protein ZapA [Hyphomicrobiaceae bacterium]|nr:cell division protein ZapA [Hyphomicrobiaceae bacterium]
MGQVTITVNGRTYRLTCGDGEEARLIQLADDLRARVDGIIAEFGHAGDDRLMLMAAIMTLDELFDLRARLASLQGPPLPVETIASNLVPPYAPQPPAANSRPGDTYSGAYVDQPPPPPPPPSRGFDANPSSAFHEHPPGPYVTAPASNTTVISRPAAPVRTPQPPRRR